MFKLEIYDTLIKLYKYEGERFEMDKNKLSSMLYYVAALCFYISAILNFTNSDSSMGVVYLCLGSTFLCLGSVHLTKLKKDNKDKDKQNKK
jgi:hypothetical protein